MKYPKTAYILLWFPEPSETFIFSEVVRLWESGFPLEVFSLYGARRRNLTPEMVAVSPRVERLGIPYLREVHTHVAYWLRRSPGRVGELFRDVPLRRWSDLESAGENLWAFLCAFRLARRFDARGIEHIHAPWANGPATAAWVASRLTGIPFSFAAHATDIYPPDGALEEKIRDCVFVRSENTANVIHLSRYAGGLERKIHMIYSGQRFDLSRRANPRMNPPFRLLALGRHVRKKGFDILLKSCRVLSDQGLDFRLTLGGSGPCERELRRLAGELEIEGKVDFPGYIRHDRVSEFLSSGDLFVMPSVVDPSGDRDGLPNVIVEALLCGLPVIASDVCGISEAIVNGVTGTLVPEKDPSALARAVTGALSDMASSLDMAESGRSFILENFSLDSSVEKLLRLFRSVPFPDVGRR